ncbi:hypothetical protein ccbrp13_20680 [Ktedonobacteria bacterium brp13]|nr:hypothetical protein ccbrp13_20680 [Ktedonobacteria bacterium brp13]
MIMEDKSFQEALEERVKSLPEEISSLVQESVHTYIEGLGRPNGKTFRQITSYIENDFIRELVYRFSQHTYLAAMISRDLAHKIINQEQSDELNEYLNLADRLIRKVDAEK